MNSEIDEVNKKFKRNVSICIAIIILELVFFLANPFEILQKMGAGISFVMFMVGFMSPAICISLQIQKREKAIVKLYNEGKASESEFNKGNKLLGTIRNIGTVLIILSVICKFLSNH
ncbi:MULTISPECIES: hypothetical protein [Clostridium]|uniref:hypothetical protein n=1 Tax=Clostridium TaxID=1485 RepID=UPI0008245AAA|nr:MULTISPECIES: hypothetical protein [Clostridium]PJI07943.1 hypothetical protein CUB90_08705 [Clostridium sp. CT7]